MKLLQDALALNAGKNPDATAVVMGDERLTYQELESSSNQLGRLLREVGCAPGDRVCLLMPKSPTAIVAIHAALKARCPYVPIDASSPAARMAKIVNSCSPRVILVSKDAERVAGELIATCSAARNARLGWLDSRPPSGDRLQLTFRPGDIEGQSANPLDNAGASGETAHILFTSGSTGDPKGVVISHQSVVAFVKWASDYFGLGPTDKNSGHPPLHFDLSTFDIFATLWAGAELHLLLPRLSLLPNKLAAYIREAELTQWFSVPSVLNYMAKLDVVAQNDFPSLERLLWCGEVFPTPPLIYWMRRLPHVKFTNLYGPTEATIASSFYTVPSCPEHEDAAIPIGAPCDGEELLVLDGQLQRVAPGTLGDLYIRGLGLSPGYWQDPDRTARAFLVNPFGAEPGDRIYKTGDLAKTDQYGQFWYHGRADSQIKSRGYRIELGEIEAALHALECVKEGAVVAIDTGGFQGATICCAYSLVEGVHATPADLRLSLSRQLPSYMLPARWAPLSVLAKNVNGKIDRRKLRERFSREPTNP